MAHDALDDLQRLLAEEKQALLAGNYTALDAIAAKKAGLLARLDGGHYPRATLENLRRKIDDNLKLTAAALEGVRSAISRITTLQQVQAGLTTYDRNGALGVRGADTPTVERKA